MLMRIARFTINERGRMAALAAVDRQLREMPVRGRALDIAFGERPIGPDSIEIVIMSIWPSVDVIHETFGDRWNEPLGTRELGDHVLASEVVHYPLIADDLPELLDFLRMNTTSIRGQ